MASFEQFLDTLSDDELELMDSDQEFFNQVKSQYDQKNPQTGLEKAVNISEKVQGAVAYPFQKAAEHIPGVAPVLGAVGKVAETIQKPFDIAGEKTTEFLGSKGVPAPISAAVGLPIQMAPDILASIAGAGPAKKGIQLGAKGVKASAKAATSPIRKVAQLVKSPGEAESRIIAEEMALKAKPAIQAEAKTAKLAEQRLTPLKERVGELKRRQTELPIQTAEREAELVQLKKGAGARIGEAETKAGLEFKSSPKYEKFIKSPKKVSQLTERLQKQYGNLPVEEVAKKVAPRKAQLYRKVFQETEAPVSGIQKAQQQALREKFAKRIDMVSEEISGNRSAYQQAIDALDDLPLEAKKKSASIKNLLSKADDEFKLESNRLKELKNMAKKADAEELMKIEQEKLSIIKKGIQRDKKIGNMKKAAIATGLTLTGLGVGKKFLGQ